MLRRKNKSHIEGVVRRKNCPSFANIYNILMKLSQFILHRDFDRTAL